jgi:hypothetical protein
LSRKLGARKNEARFIGKVFERVVEGMRNEMSTVLWRIEWSRDCSPKALKKFMRTGLEAMIGAVEKVMYGVSDGLAKDWKEKEQKEDATKDIKITGSGVGEEGKRKAEESWSKVEDRLERKLRETEERWKESEDHGGETREGIEEKGGRGWKVRGTKEEMTGWTVKGCSRKG